jgi:hypothetical protein
MQQHWFFFALTRISFEEFRGWEDSGLSSLTLFHFSSRFVFWPFWQLLAMIPFRFLL